MSHTTVRAPLPQRDRIAEYERWLRGRGPSSAAMRWWMGGPGTLLANTALFRLPEELQLDEDWRVVEVGCGRGALLRMLDDRVGFLSPPVGVDASRAAVRLAREDERRARGARPRLRFVQGAATILPLAPASAELVLAGHLVKHLGDEELEPFFREIWRVLVPGGLALLWEFAPTGSLPLDRWNAWLLARGVRRPRLRSTRSLLNAAGRAGFEFRIDARLRPFLLPPIPRASILLGRPPATAADVPPEPQQG
ncbi:MAG: class I SAM-dependent methyltransferase [Chloroflexi bacterium]|nr:class I SAM-dependent methyltransferase [Chloroflexota bacterium]